MATHPRKRKVTYNVSGHAHFLTYSCFQRLPLLSADRSRGWVVETLQEARGKALDARRLRHEGIDPIEARRSARLQARLEAAKAYIAGDGDSLRRTGSTTPGSPAP